MWLLASLALAGDPHIVTWNARELFTVDDLDARRDDVRALKREQRPDVLLVQEIGDCDVADQLGKLLGLSHVACSDFVREGEKWGSFEVAILSRWPLSGASEFDPEPDDLGLNELKLQLSPQIPTRRGYVTATVRSKNLQLYAFHLKSARGKVGEEDADNAQQREYIAQAVMEHVRRVHRSHPTRAILAGGDFNVGHSDERKNGQDLTEDCLTDCEGQDLYDDTHAVFDFDETIDLTNALQHVTDSSYPAYPGTPIDNIYVWPAERFGSAELLGTFGSDHRAAGVRLLR